MSMVLSLLGLCGVTMTAYSLSPYFGALGLVLVSFSVCCLLSGFGLSFLGLVVLLTYLGGMMVVFIYSSALTLDRFPAVGSFWGFSVTFGSFLWVLFYKGWGSGMGDFGFTSKFESFFVESADWRAVGVLYKNSFGLVFIVGLCLLVALVLALMVTFGCYKKSLRSM